MKEHWWKIALALALPAVGGLCALAVTKSVVEKDIPAIHAKNKEQDEAIDQNENALISMQGTVEAIEARQEIYHDDSDKKLDAILKAVER